LKGVSLLGPIIRKTKHGLKLANSYYLQSRKNIFQTDHFPLEICG